jgi:Leucine-rich repeat (LRR) protein
MIIYKDITGEIHEKKYAKETNNINLCGQNIAEIIEIKDLQELSKLDLSSNRITEIKGLDELTNLFELDLSSNQITEIKGLDKLTNISILILHSNQINEIKSLDKLTKLSRLSLSLNQITKIKGLEKLTNLLRLYLRSNQITEIKGLDKLTNLAKLYLCLNKITEIKSLDKLTNLSELYLSSNRIIEIKGLDELTNLSIISLYSNQITEIKGLDKLTNLSKLYLSSNKITKIKGLDKLTNLFELSLSSNQITEVPLSIINNRNLQKLYIDCAFSPIIDRFLNRNTIKNNKTIYDDSQNVHDNHIVKSIKESIHKIMSESKNTDLSLVLKNIIDDNILDKRTKEQLVDYCHDKTVHSILNLTFDEVLCCVWQVISEHKECTEIKKILNTEMKDSMCKCFTGRLSRLVNCLNGFDSRVTIKISDTQEILNIIIRIRNKYDNVDKQKEEIIRELSDRGFEKDIIDEYIIYLE